MRGSHPNRKRRPVMDRFTEKFIPEPMSGCWLWIGAIKRDPKYRNDRLLPCSTAACRSDCAASMLAWELYHHPMPAGMCVLHTLRRKKLIPRRPRTSSTMNAISTIARVAADAVEQIVKHAKTLRRGYAIVSKSNSLFGMKTPDQALVLVMAEIAQDPRLRPGLHRATVGRAAGRHLADP